MYLSLMVTVGFLEWVRLKPLSLPRVLIGCYDNILVAASIG